MFKILDDEALKAAIEEDSSLACDQLTERFQVSDETIKLHMHNIVKTFKLIKWVPHTLLDVKKQQRISARFSVVLSAPQRIHIRSYSSVTKSGGSYMVLYTGCQLRTLWLSPQDYPYNCENHALYLKD